MIAKLDKDYVCVMLNVTDDGFPKDAPGLKAWQDAYEKDPKYRVAYSTSVVLGSNGGGAFATSGCGHQPEWKVAISYQPDKYLSFLTEAHERFTRATAITRDLTIDRATREEKLKEIAAACLEQITEAARCKVKDGERTK